MQVGKVGCAGFSDPFPQTLLVAGTGVEKLGEAADRVGKIDHFRAGRGQLVTQLPLGWAFPVAWRHRL